MQMPKVRPNFKTRRRTFIKAWRKHRGLTLAQLSERVGVTIGAISQVENSGNYTRPMLEAIADVLRCEPADLLMRNPSDPDGPWSIWERLTPVQRRQAITILKTLGDDKSGTDS